MRKDCEVTAYPTPHKAALSVVIPVYNAEQWMSPTLEKLWESLSKNTWRSIEIIVVDDGSTDKTVQVVKAIKLDVKIQLITQKNKGRFLARQAGLKAAKGDYIFFIDSRVFALKDSFSALVRYMKNEPEAVVWNGHVEVERDGNLYARFWHVITFIAWRRYMAKPRLIHYGSKDFDYYPKGTTCFLAPRALLLRAYKQFETGYGDLRNANDDSSLIRYIAKETDIWLAPEFAFTYHSRSTLRAFTRHTIHRGVVFIDGFLHKGTRYYYPLIAYLALLPISIIIVILVPKLLLGLPIALLIVWLTALALRINVIDAAAFSFVLPGFAVLYTVGLYKGLSLKLSALLQRHLEKTALRNR